MLYGIILFCKLATMPQDCDEVSATRYERVPGGHPWVAACLFQSQVYAAEHELIPQPGEYPKVRCSRTEFGGRVG